MRVFFHLCLLSIIIASCQPQDQQKSDSSAKGNVSGLEPHEYAIAVHGGAGYMKKGVFSDSLENAYKDKLKRGRSSWEQAIKRRKFCGRGR